MAEQDLQQLNNNVDVEPVTELSPKRKKFNKVVDVLLWVVIALLAAAILIRAFFFTQITVSGDSMLQTFHDTEVVGVSKVKKPHRGDVVVFYKNEGANKFLDIFVSNSSKSSGKYEKLIKRVVATAGDKMWVEAVDGETNLYKVVIETPDGKQLCEDYYVRDSETLDQTNFYIDKTLPSGSDLGRLADHIGKANALLISENCIFVMGDNRSNSSDSRSFGEVPLSRLYGVVL